MTRLLLPALLACTQATPPPPAPDLLPELERIEARLVTAAAIRAHWQIQATHDPQLTHCTDAALTRRVR